MFEFLTKESRERVEKKIKEAEARAEARGKKAGLLETAKNMILSGMPLQVISEITKLSIPELRRIELKIQEQMRNK